MVFQELPLPMHERSDVHVAACIQIVHICMGAPTVTPPIMLRWHYYAVDSSHQVWLISAERSLQHSIVIADSKLAIR